MLHRQIVWYFQAWTEGKSRMFSDDEEDSKLEDVNLSDEDSLLSGGAVSGKKNSSTGNTLQPILDGRMVNAKYQSRDRNYRNYQLDTLEVTRRISKWIASSFSGRKGDAHENIVDRPPVCVCTRDVRRLKRLLFTLNRQLIVTVSDTGLNHGKTAEIPRF
ncbi:unnamed protein product [Peronospora farinosa]|uniref:Uncharacterized protein n=1 Tax=Peronospora farinosa TaxID=134698 RepID=A0ABN8CKL1_9STRA|nr:unnamed protein product [Peronospora farinosa]